jgi:two-component system chemotaxis sensor kinase CheA
MLDDIVKEFLVESYENLDQLDKDLMALEDAPDDKSRLSSVFRTIHTIKGTSGFLAYPNLEHLAHVGENLLVLLRDGALRLNAEITTTLLSMLDAIRSILGRIESTGTEGDETYADLIATLERLKNREPQSQVAAPAAVAQTVVEHPCVEIELEQAVREFSSEVHATLVTEPVNEATAAQSEIRPAAKAKSKKKSRSATKAEDPTISAVSVQIPQHNAPVNRDVPSKTAPAEMPRTAPAEPSHHVHEDGHETTTTHNSGSTVKKTSAAAEGRSTADGGTAGSEGGEKNGSVTDTTVRIDVQLLDKLMNLVGELVLARNQIMQFSGSIEDAAMSAASQRLNLITTELQAGVMKTRMQPIRNAWAKLPRVVRDLSISCGKKVQVVMEGEDTELDKTILEAIKDPLTHIVRNSVDHGIEPSDVRVKNGKSAEGTLWLRAYHEGGQVIIEIADDGGGISLDRVRQKAIEKGMVTAEQAAAMSDRESIQLILLPGFSTAAKVTNVSGRGVGMDVVKTNVEKIGGTLDIQSRLGQGTTLRIKIPLTLAIIPALIVTTAGDRYAIPQVSLLELVRLEGEQVRTSIEYVHGAPVYRLRGKLLPLVDLSERLGVVPANSDARQSFEDRIINIVVLRANDRQYGLVVDKVNDTAEIVVKPLSRQLKGIAEYAGTTIMGDGSVALILDVMGIAIAAGLTGDLRDQAHASAGRDSSQTAEPTQTLLVVDLGDARRFALPTSMVARLEKVPGSAIEYTDGREVIQYRGAILPVVRLQHVFGGGSADSAESDELQLIVYAEEDHHCGFAVNRIVDIVETELRLQTKNGDHDNLLGTTVIQQRVTDVLNLRNLARHGA